MIAPFRRSVERMKAGLTSNTASLTEFMTRETYLNLKPFSFLGHEYQEFITKLVESNPEIHLSIIKCSQIGISELFHRVILSKMAVLPGTSVLLAMPTITFAAEVFKTRINNVITQSPALRDLMNKNVDSATVKMLTNGSIMYGLGAGAQSNSSLINRPIQLCVVDELDKCDQDIVTGFRSRQTHSVYKPRIYISTPTVEGVGIDAEYDDSETRYKQTVICNSCKHEFFPDYYEHIRVKGFDDPLVTLTRHHIETLSLDLSTAEVFCPKCLGKPKLTPKYRHWAREGASDSIRIGVRLTPFDAPSFITASDLIRSALTYSSDAEFRNQALGLTSKVSESSISAADLAFVNATLGSDRVNVLGLDLGKVCHAVVASIGGDGKFVIHSPEAIPLGELESRIDYLYSHHNLAAVVADSLPYTDLINRFTSRYANFWSARYNVPAQPVPEMYQLKTKDDSLDATSGKVRMAVINKNPFFDMVATLLRSQTITFITSEYDATIISHVTDMRRVRDYKYSEVRYKWVKSRKKEDHFFHSVIYSVMAGKLLTRNSVNVNPNQLLKTFKLKGFYA